MAGGRKATESATESIPFAWGFIPVSNKGEKLIVKTVGGRAAMLVSSKPY